MHKVWINLPPYDALELSRKTRRDLRSDHAGEAGAVSLYLGILSVTQEDDVAEFAKDHLKTESEHLTLLENWLPAHGQSRLIGLWKLSGRALGAFAALMGQRFTFATIVAVEEFVIAHYAQQIAATDGALQDLLLSLQADESLHRADAANRLHSDSAVPPPLWCAVWSRIISAGSAAAVQVARLA